VHVVVVDEVCECLDCGGDWVVYVGCVCLWWFDCICYWVVIIGLFDWWYCVGVIVCCGDLFVCCVV